MRALFLSVLAVSLMFAKWQLQLTLAYTEISLILCVAGLVTIVTFWRLQFNKPISERELFTHLMLDFITLSLLLYFAGGATNPIVSYYLIPLIIAATSLPQRYTWVIAVLSITAYCLLLFFYQPLEWLAPQHHQNGHSGFNTHLVGMLVTFMFSVLLITYFIVRMANTLRQRDQALAAARENTLRDEHILAIATMAAGTAHQLGTPLSTISVLVNEMKRNTDFNHEEIDLIKEQIHLCKSTLQTLSNVAEISQSNNTATKMPADEYIRRLVDQWRAMRPEATPQINIAQNSDIPMIDVSPPLDQAIHNLLNNAEDASPGYVRIVLSWTDKEVMLAIQDQGEGIKPEIAEHIGKPFFTTKSKGMGLGLFLSHAAIERHQGTIKMIQENGTRVELTLPISN